MKPRAQRIWTKLFGRGDFDPSMTEAEKAVARHDMARQQAERQRLQDEMSLRAARNTIGGF
ncbi:MAG: hypothetical protein ABIO06_08760 [Pseudolysinimonas sp.]